ncbi:tectonic-2 isoform X2 [Dromaius novaehollandiae]|uniref:tectonic-2 isoform X2 n=1 Tax=Dromaius novaehollandiae TaxID=8790 RepID=UPI000E1EC0CA|nr:tectonic-2 isoform X2 [Dromaius novaehollandiae]
MVVALLEALLLLLAAPCPGQRARGPVFQPSFIHMSGPRVNALFLGNSSEVSFSLILSRIDEETGKLQHSNCSGSRRAGDWNLSVVPGVNTSKVTVSLSRNLQLCLPNATDCCTAPLCVAETLQVLACHGSVMLAHLLIQAEIYANSSFVGNVSENATIIPNQAFQPLGSCPCDLTAGACDVRCCCDLECTPDLKQLFTGSCFTAVFGGDVNPPFDQLCSAKSMDTPDWFPFLCVQSSLDNTPFLGYFYHGSISTPREPSFKIPLQTSPGRVFTGYRQGDPIMTEENDYFTVPQQSMAGQCVGNAPVAYLQNFDVKCLTHLSSYGEGLPHDVRINSGTGDFIQQNVIYGTITDIDKFITKSESPPTTEVPCKNVTFAEYYKFICNDKNIKEINVTVFLGNLCDGEILTQRFTVTFVSLYSTNETELSGNPGYQVGKPVRAANLNDSDTFGSLKLWQPDSLSGCMLEVGISEDCNFLRGNVTEKLNSLIQATHIGKRGNSNDSDLNDWVQIIRLDPYNSDTNVSTGNLKGICSDIPANLNIRIIIADVGAVQGIPQQEILAVQISYSTVIWQFQCGLTCENLNFLPITASVHFIKVPAQPPIPLTRFQINYTEFDCDRNDVCWPQLFYPLTRFYTGEPYSLCLAKGLALAFLFLLAAIMSNPWFQKVWNNSLV